MGGGNCRASHLCKGQPNYRCTALMHWGLMTFLLLTQRLAVYSTFFVGAVRPCFCIKGNMGTISKSATCSFCIVMFQSLLWIHKLWLRNIQLSLLQCSIKFPRFVPAFALQGCINNSAGLLVRVLSNSLQGTDWSNPPLWRWGGHMEAKDKGTTWLGFS